MKLQKTLWFLMLAGCTGEELSHSDWSCSALEKGAEVAATLRADDAPTVATGLRAYRVVFPPEGIGFVAFDWDGGPVEILVDRADIVSAVQQGPTQFSFDASDHPTCPDLISDVYTMDLDPGRFTVKVGPSSFAETWVSIGAAE